jgi:hypothetical protein
MELAITRSCAVDQGTWLREPSQHFVLTIRVAFSEDERWTIDAHSLYHHVILNRTPPWYFPALRQAQRNQDRAAEQGEAFEWPWYVPPSVPPEWILTVARLLEDPVYTVTFDPAYELSEFEPRMMAAFRDFKQFLSAYGSRPETVYRRF